MNFSGYSKRRVDIFSGISLKNKPIHYTHKSSPYKCCTTTALDPLLPNKILAPMISALFHPY